MNDICSLNIKNNAVEIKINGFKFMNFKYLLEKLQALIRSIIKVPIVRYQTTTIRVFSKYKNMSNFAIQLKIHLIYE
jgi:hypothetical protein